MNPADRSNLVRTLAARVGFDACGIARPDPLERGAYYTAWLAAGQHGSMEYLARHAQVRRSPSEALPGCRSVICVALSYHRPALPANAAARPAASAAAGAPAASPELPESGRVAMYARGEDYHVVLRRKLDRLAQEIRAALPEPSEFRACVDTAPVIERELAARAGLGWIGKNTLILNRRLGSYVVLGELFTTLELEPDVPETDHCGTCTRCLDACPTRAFPAPYQMDATRCISYFTIEHRGEVAPELAARAGDWLFGCDVCQQVCPHNFKAPPGRDPDLMTERVPDRLALESLMALRSGEYRRLTGGTALRRASRRMWQRNAERVRRYAGQDGGPVA